MADIKTGAPSNQFPPEGPLVAKLIAVVHADGQYGPQVKVTIQAEVPVLNPETGLPVEPAELAFQNFTRFLSYPKGPLPIDNPIALLAAAALFGKDSLKQGETFDDDNPDFVGKWVRTTIRYYLKGEKSKHKGDPEWTYNDFAPYRAVIASSEADRIRASFDLVLPDLADNRDELAARAATEIEEAVGAPRKVADLTREEADKVWVALRYMAKTAKVTLPTAVVPA